MRLKLTSVLMALLVLASAAAEERKTSSYNGLIELTRGDAGGFAVDIKITGPSFQLERGVEPPSIAIHFSQVPALGNNQVIKLKSSEASKCLKQGRCQFATSGELRIDRSTSAEVTGHYELHFKNDETITGPFKLRWASSGLLNCY
ncbi:MAG: hypothetical protein ACXVZX_06215 [Terriglobales bacterium]